MLLLMLFGLRPHRVTRHALIIPMKIITQLMHDRIFQHSIVVLSNQSMNKWYLFINALFIYLLDMHIPENDQKIKIKINKIRFQVISRRTLVFGSGSVVQMPLVMNSIWRESASIPPLTEKKKNKHFSPTCARWNSFKGNLACCFHVSHHQWLYHNNQCIAH